MSKKKNKFKSESKSTESKGVMEEKTSKTSENPQDGMKKEFLNVLSVMILITAILAVLYYYDQKNGVLETMTDQLFNMF